METINGEWYMLGCNPDDPACIHSIEELRAKILEMGFLPLFSNKIPGFSVEEHTVPGNWWTDDPDKDPWAWRQILSRDPDIAYGKFFDKKAGFISKEWFPVFANYRRNGYDFDALCGDELVPYRNQKLMEAFEFDDQMNSLELLSNEAKQKAGFGKGGQKNFEGVLTELQMQTYLIMSNFRQRKNKKGQEYGWHIAALETPETKWGYDHIASGYYESPKDSWEKIKEQVRLFFPDAGDKDLQGLLGIRYPGEPRMQKKHKKQDLPYPDGLLVKLGVPLPATEDQIEGLNYALEKLYRLEQDIIFAKYRDGLSYTEIGAVCNKTAERVEIICRNAIKKLKKPVLVPYYMDGYVKTLVRLEVEKEQHAKALLEKASAADQNGMIHTSVYDMGLTTRTTNCLIKGGVNTLQDILLLLADNPKKLRRIRNIGIVGYGEIMAKLKEYGVRLESLAGEESVR